MTEWETLEVEQHGRVKLIRFNRPNSLNAFNGTMYSEFRRAIEDANADPSVGAIVSTGNGRAYSAGADIGGFNACLLYTSPSPRDGLLSRMPSSA